MGTVKITQSAQTDLKNIFDYVAVESQQKAITLLNAIDKAISSLH